MYSLTKMLNSIRNKDRQSVPDTAVKAAERYKYTD